MDRSRFSVSPGIVLDARRAVWLEEDRVLAVADLHLGYAWAQRSRGMLLPLSAADDTTARLLALVEDYAPRTLVILGDIVHRAVPLEPLREELRALHAALAPRTALRFLAGNHDRNLAPLLAESGISASLLAEFRAGPHLLLHGDANAAAAARQVADAEATGGRIFLGHEHPAITLGDGVATAVKCPCFLLVPPAVVLPAFSAWAAGSDVRRHDTPLSPLLQRLRATAPARRAVAILAGKLLPVPLGH